MRTLLINTLIAAAGACLAWSMMNAVFWIDFQIADPLPPNVADFDSLTPDQIEAFDSFEWHDRVRAQRARIRFIYVPAVSILLVAGVGLLSRSWQWTWLVAIVALSPAAIWAGIVTSVKLGAAVLAGLVYLFAGAGLATGLSWYRTAPRTRQIPPSPGEIE